MNGLVWPNVSLLVDFGILTRGSVLLPMPGMVLRLSELLHDMGLVL